jgi:geranylgeranyl pyrophosphate synthase
MMTALREKYAPHLAELNRVMLSELMRWRSTEIEFVWSVTHAQLQRRGKQLRPLLALMMADYLGGEPSTVIPAAASVEFYHAASLILDDVQDHSEIRRGQPTVNASTSASTAVNVALFVRSLSYHMVSRCVMQDCAGQLRTHQELDLAATHLILGQSIDIGWHEDWYESYRDFPYLKMVEGKSGALFGCAAAVGASASKDDPAVISAARDYGIAFGALYQMVDDYLDVFGDATVLRRPQFEDFREGKMTGPVISLLSALEDRDRQEDITLVLARLKGREPAARDWEWLLELMREHDVAGKLRKDISDRASRLAEPAIPPARSSSVGDFAQLVQLIVAPAGQG